MSEIYITFIKPSLKAIFWDIIKGKKLWKILLKKKRK